MGCGCKQKKVLPVIETTSDFDNIDEFFISQTQNQLLDKELTDWKNLDKFEDEEEYPLIHD